MLRVVRRRRRRRCSRKEKIRQIVERTKKKKHTHTLVVVGYAACSSPARPDSKQALRMRFILLKVSNPFRRSNEPALGGVGAGLNCEKYILLYAKLSEIFPKMIDFYHLPSYGRQSEKGVAMEIP